MHIQVNSDRNIKADAEATAKLERVIRDGLDLFRHRTTRVEVHLGDENGDKGGDDDKRCMMEARVEGRPPKAVTHHATSVEEAVDGALDKLKRALQHEFGRLRRHR
jgi:ribosome-associated translation inhibitor RaiA